MGVDSCEKASMGMRGSYETAPLGKRGSCEIESQGERGKRERAAVDLGEKRGHGLGRVGSPLEGASIEGRGSYDIASGGRGNSDGATRAGPRSKYRAVSELPTCVRPRDTLFS